MWVGFLLFGTGWWTLNGGTYTIFFLVPGDYDVSVDAGEGFTATPVTVPVGESADVTDVDFEITVG